MSESLKQVLMRRDNISSNQADKLINQAREELFELLEENDQESAQDICMDHFGLEPDYLIELL